MAILTGTASLAAAQGGEKMLFHFSTVLLFLGVGFVFVFAGLFVARLLGKLTKSQKPSSHKLMPYECGEHPVGPANIQFNIRFYIVALIFIIFDVEILMLFPWAVVFRSIGPIALIEMLIFVGILLVGLAYVWAKGDLEWSKKYRPPPEPEAREQRVKMK